MKKQIFSLLLISLIGLLALAPVSLSAADQSTAAAPLLKYKLISGYKQPFTDNLQLHLAKGWISWEALI